MKNEKNVNNLKSIRISAGFMQYAVANKLNVSRKTLQRWESGQTLPKVKNLIKLSEIYNCKVEELL